MKKFIIGCLLCLSINGIAQDMDVVKYGVFSHPFFPFMNYQSFAVNKIPMKMEEVTYSYNNTDKNWEKKEEISYFFNPDGFINYTTTKTYYADVLTDFYKRTFSYTNNFPTKILVTRDKKYMSQKGELDGLINKLEYITNNGELVAIITDKDTIDTKSGELIGKVHQLESQQFSNYDNIVYTFKTLGLTMSKHHSYSSSDDRRALFHFREKYQTIDIYLPNDRTFYYNKTSKYPDSDIETLKNALAINIEAYEKLLLEPNYFNENIVQGEGHLTFKDGINGNWIAIFNKKSSYFDAPQITMRKITFPDNSVEGTLLLDESLSKKVK